MISTKKRMLDLTACLILAAPSAILILLFLPLIALETRAIPLFLQIRVGEAGRAFTLFKLRTMAASTADGASHDVGISTVTHTGHLLRRTKIDELPQLWNVALGDMSLVGPRPCLPSQTELIERRRQNGVLALRPGITGPAQVAGIDMSEPLLLAQADAAYLQPWSLRRDLTILLRTVLGGGSGDAAAKRR